MDFKDRIEHIINESKEQKWLNAEGFERNANLLY